MIHFSTNADEVKTGSSFSYGVRVCPLVSDTQSCMSQGTYREYDVWRRWEDCLWFQDVIEYEYSIMARSKRDRLAAGKGIKKDGIYIHSDGAASFDSLPPGPEASSVAMDIHEIIPKLTKKGTFFRPSQTTIDQRSKEFKALVEALLEEDVPTLIKELREIRVVRDFFGIWRRDKDLERKVVDAHKKAVSGRPKSRASVTSSTLSMYFSSSNMTLMQSDTNLSATTVRSRSSSEASRQSSPRPVRSVRTPATAPMTFSVTEDGALTSPTQEYDDARGGLRSAPVRTMPRWSTATSITPSECPSDASGVPIMFVSGDERIQARMTIDKHPGLQALPEEEEVVEGMSGLSLAVPPHYATPPRRPRGYSAPDRQAGYRNGLPTRGQHVPEAIVRDSAPVMDTNPYNNHTSTIYTTPHLMEVPKTSGPGSNSSKRSSVELSIFSDRSSWRNSSLSVTSIASNPSTGPNSSSSDDDKGMLETPVTSQKTRFSKSSHVPRDSLATVDSFVASSVMESFLSRRSSPPRTPNRRSFSVGDRQSRVPCEGVPEEAWDERDDIMAAYFYG